MLWLALLPSASPCTDGLAGLSTWCLQFTARVAVVPATAGASYPAAVVMELQASLRLFGGQQALAAHIERESAELGVAAAGWAPTSMAAVALARAGGGHASEASLAAQLGGLPLHVLDAVQPHAPTLERLGCQTLGQVRALPRSGLGRRFGSALLLALDQAYGLQPEVHEWVVLPEQFHARLELPARVEMASLLLQGARRLLLQLCGWLCARCCGVTVFALHWQHDVMRARNVDAGGSLQVRTAAPMCQPEPLSQLLAEHLAHVVLQAPVGCLELIAEAVEPFEAPSYALLPGRQAEGQALAEVLTRVQARLGAQRVLRPVLLSDHRPEWQVHWQSAEQPLPRQNADSPALPQPGFLLSEPLKLATGSNQLPEYQGVLQLVSGPHRIEGGWWHSLAGGTVLRDYWVAFSQQAGVLWVYQTRLASERGAWYLHGVFA